MLVEQGTPSASGLAQDAPVLPVDENPGQRLGSFAEGDLLRRCAATYCELTPPPRSTIAAAFSPDGALLASTQCAPPRPSCSYCTGGSCSSPSAWSCRLLLRTSDWALPRDLVRT